jgi:hypothetical protein
VGLPSRSIRLTRLQDEVKNDIRQKKRQRNVKDHDGDKTEPKAPEKRVSFG